MFLIVVVLTKTNIYNIMFASLFASSLTFIRESLFIIHFSLSLSLLKISVILAISKNSALGLLFYSYWLFLMPTLPNVLTIIVSSMAMASSVFLAIKLVILNELCILCWSTHVINSRLFWSVMANLVLGGNNNNSSSNKKKIKSIKRV